MIETKSSTKWWLNDAILLFFLFYIEMTTKLKVVLGNSIVMMTKLKVGTIDFFF